MTGGNYYYYSGSFSEGQAAGENFCEGHPSVYSCSYYSTQPPVGFDWCLLDPDYCSAEHPDHEYTWLE